MLKAHLDAIEKKLLAEAGVSANTGHPLHKGTPRENFISEFLQNHLSAKAAIGSGEIISADSIKGEIRNQFDIVLYKSEYPKIHISKDINAYLCESVISTIEVKSTLTRQAVHSAVDAARRAKKLRRNLTSSMSSGYLPPGIMSYIVSYDGPSAETAYTWLKDYEKSLNINNTPLPASRNARLSVANESIDGIFILGKGSLFFDNYPISLTNDLILENDRSIKYTVIENNSGNVLWMFLLLTPLTMNISSQYADLAEYLQREKFQGVKFGP